MFFFLVSGIANVGNMEGISQLNSNDHGRETFDRLNVKTSIVRNRDVKFYGT